MSKSFIKQNIRLSLEFDKFIINKPEVAQEIPRGAFVILTVAGNQEFNSNSRALVRVARRQGKNVIEARKEKTGWVIRPLAPA